MAYLLVYLVTITSSLSIVYIILVCGIFPYFFFFELFGMEFTVNIQILVIGVIKKQSYSIKESLNHANGM